MSSLSNLKFFTTPSHECSYLPGKRATTLFVDPGARVDTEVYSALSALGFRRSGVHLYRPYCQTCNACIPVRVPAQGFMPKRGQLRIAKKNQGLTVSRERPAQTNEYFGLYRRYIAARHADGDMFPASREQFASFLVEGRPEASFYVFRDGKKLLAVAVADQLHDGLSAIYTFFDPTQNKRGLGVYAVLWLLDEVRRAGLDYLYLGYWVRQCRKMSYKVDYKPLQFFVNNSWIDIDS